MATFPVTEFHTLTFSETCDLFLFRLRFSSRHVCSRQGLEFFQDQYSRTELSVLIPEIIQLDLFYMMSSTNVSIIVNQSSTQVYSQWLLVKPLAAPSYPCD